MTTRLINEDERNGARKATEMILKRARKTYAKIEKTVAEYEQQPESRYHVGYANGALQTIADIIYDLTQDLENDTAGSDD